MIRSAFAELLYQTADPRVTGRLNGALVKVVRAVAVNSRGERTVIDGDLSLLEGFNFNKNAKLEETFHAPFTATADHGSGAMVIDIPSFVPSKMISAPKGATHFRLKAGGAAIDFEKNDFVVGTSESGGLPLTRKVQEPLQLKVNVGPNSVKPFFLILGIEFIQMVNGVERPLKNAAFNAMAVTKAKYEGVNHRRWSVACYNNSGIIATRLRISIHFIEKLKRFTDIPITKKLNMVRSMIIALSFMIVCCSQQKLDTKAEGEKVMQLSKEWSDAVASGNIEKVVSYWAEDAIVMSAGQPTYKGKDAIRQMVEESFKIPGFSISWQPLSVQVSESGDLAYLIENSQVSFTDSTGNAVTQNNRAVSIWRKQADGSWKNVVDISTPDL